MRIITVITLCAVGACSAPAPSPEAGTDAAEALDIGSAVDAADIGAPDAADPEAGPADASDIGHRDAGATDAATADAGSAATCADGIGGQAILCLEISSANPVALPDNFSGFIVHNFRDGWQPWDPRFIEFAKRFTPGSISIGSVYSWDWHSGSIPLSHVTEHQRKANKYNQLMDYHKVLRGKGYIKLDDYARAAAQLDAALVIEANARNSSPASIQAFAQTVARRGYKILYWKLSSEPIYWSDSNWCDRPNRPCAPFHDGGDGYAADMKPYFDAITAGYAAAGVATPPQVIHHSEGGHTQRQRRFDGVEIDPQGQLAAFSGAKGIAFYGSLADQVTHPNRRKYWDDWGHNWFAGMNKYTLSDGAEITCTSNAAQHWNYCRKDLDYTLTARNEQIIDDYHLRVNGMDGFDRPVAASLRGNIGSYAVRSTTPYSEVSYAAIFAVESMLRWSTHPRLRSVAYFSLTSACMGQKEKGRTAARRAGNYSANSDPSRITNKVANSQDNPYGVFDHLPCLAFGLANRAVNLATARLESSHNGGVEVAANHVELSAQSGGYEPAQEDQMVAATYSQSYLGRDGIVRLVVTNRSATSHDLDLIHAGRRLSGADLIAAQVISTPTALARNYGPLTDSEEPTNACVPDRPQGHQDQVVESIDLNQALSIRPWSVTLLEYRPPSNALPAPGGLVVVGATERFEAAWSEVVGATNYRVLWGTSPGAYTSSAEVDTNSFNLDYLHGIPVYFAVATGREGVFGPPSAEQSTQTEPLLLASDDFAAVPLAPQWHNGCTNARPWGVIGGRLGVTANANGRYCTVRSDSGATDQWVSVNFQHSGWPSPPAFAQFGLIGRYQNAQTFVLGALRLAQNTNGGWNYKAVIEVHHPSLPNGFLAVGRSPRFRDMNATIFQVDPQSGALLNGQQSPAHLELELNGRTLRLFMGAGANRRMIAAGLDAFSVPQGGGAITQAPLELDLERTGPGSAGVLTHGMNATFDDFSVR
jgi:hypothetical protein